jgi:hypothetical protein
MAGRSKAPAIGSAGWILEERHQSNDLVSQELEDFGFSVRNELEWLNEHMSDVFANNGQYVAPAILSACSILTGDQAQSRGVQNTRQVTRQNASHCTQEGH